MNQDEINAIANKITQQWIDLLRAKKRLPPIASAHVDEQTAAAFVRKLALECSLALSESNTTNTFPGSQNQFFKELEIYSRRVLRYEDKELLERALEIIPIHRLYDEASVALEEKSLLDPEASTLDEEVVRRLLHWFKNEFFTWVNEMPCQYCGSATVAIGTVPPSPEDAKFGAGLVELYQCTVCERQTRFPRYNDPGKLLETRRGRCGEWANCFTLCCRAIGCEARLVFDKTDHVWTEVFSESQQRWVHCDSCEEAYDQPLLYSVGWNKKLSYCVAFSAEEAMDVTRRYVQDWPETLTRRTLVNEETLANFLNQITAERQKGLDKDRRSVLRERRKREEEELAKPRDFSTIKAEERVGRQSGSTAWKTARGESGVNKVESAIEEYKKGYRILVENPTPGQLQLVGNVTILSNESTSGTLVRLTAAENSQCGAVWWNDQLGLATKAFEVEFAFRITDASGGPATSGADGFAFVIQSQSGDAIGQGGCELGYGGLQKSLAIEFDTYQSSDRCSDPSGNHISVHGCLPPQPLSAHHKYSLGYTSLLPPMNNGSQYHVRIRYLIEKQTIQVALKTDDDSEYISVLVVENLDLKAYLGGESKAWIGFTGSTGGISQNHDIQWTRVAVYDAVDSRQ